VTVALTRLRSPRPLSASVRRTAELLALPNLIASARAKQGGRRLRTVRRVGVISDTHGLLRPEAMQALAGSDLIVHAGDVGGPEVLDRLRELASVVAVRGNNDRDRWARVLPERVTVDIAGWRVCLVHDVNTLGLDPAAAGLDAVIAGHSHRPRVEWCDGVLFLNPGSAGPRRFALPVAVARLRVDGPRLDAEILELTGPGAPTRR
jgi:uncharacterized protein